MMRMLLLAGVASAALTAQPVEAQPQSGVAPARGANRAAAPPLPTYRDILDQDVRDGAITPDQAEGLAQRGEARYAEFERRANQGGGALENDLITRGRENEQSWEESGVRGNGAGGRTQAEGIVDVGREGFANAEQGAYELERGTQNLVSVGVQNARDRYDAIVANPNSTPAQREAAERTIRATEEMGTRLASSTGAVQYQAGRARREVEERREEIVNHVEERIRNEGTDPRTWQNPRATRPPPTGRAAAPAAPTQPAPAAPATPLPSTPTAAAPAGRTGGGGTRGVIPPADPYEGLRVPNPSTNPTQSARPQPRQPSPVPSPPAPQGNADSRGGRAADAADDNVSAPGNAGRRGGSTAGAAALGGVDTGQGQPPTGNAAQAAGRNAEAADSAVLDGLIQQLPRPGQMGQGPSLRSTLIASVLLLGAGALTHTGRGNASEEEYGAENAPSRRPGTAAGRANTSSQTGAGGAQRTRDPFARAPAADEEPSVTAAALPQQRRPAPIEQPRQPGGPGYPQANSRVPRERAPSARNGDWGPGDSFGGALEAANRATETAAPPDAVDVARNEIQERSDRVMEAWDRYAENVDYDENGVLRRRRPAEQPAPPAPNARPAPRPQPVPDPTWESFENGGTLEVAELESIYEGWDIDTAPPGSSGRSLSAAGMSMRMDWHLTGSGGSLAEIAADRANGILIGSAAEMGLPLEWGAADIDGTAVRVNGRRGPVPGSLASIHLDQQVRHPSMWETALDMDNPWTYRPLADDARQLAEGLYGPLWSDRRFRVIRDPTGRLGRFSDGAELAGFTGALERDELIRILRTSGREGLRRILSQPFNVLLTWGEGAFDVDLHMTGAGGDGRQPLSHLLRLAWRAGRLSLRPTDQGLHLPVGQRGDPDVAAAAGRDLPDLGVQFRKSVDQLDRAHHRRAASADNRARRYRGQRRQRHDHPGGHGRLPRSAHARTGGQYLGRRGDRPQQRADSLRRSR
jgi:hypothetical protein